MSDLARLGNVRPEPSEVQLKAFLGKRGVTWNDFQGMRAPIRLQLMRECQAHYYGPKTEPQLVPDTWGNYA